MLIHELSLAFQNTALVNFLTVTWKSCKVASEQMKGNSEGSKDADVGFELNVKSREMLDEGQKWGGGGRGGAALCLRAPTLVS